MLPIRLTIFAALALALTPAVALSQALTNITSLYIGYNARRVAANPTGELKARLDSLDQQLADARRWGRLGEMRRLIAKGNMLVSGRAWTDSAEFAHSLLLRTDRVVVDSRQPYVVRLEQLYMPAIALPRPLSVRATLLTRPTVAGATVTPGQVVKDFGRHEGVSRDLRESPLAMDLDLRGVADGRYVLVVDVADSTRQLGSASLGMVVRAGIDEVVARLENEAERAPVDLRAPIRYPGERMRNVNRGVLELRTLDVERDFARADSVATAARQGRDPFLGRKGDFKRHYRLEAANEILPYRLLVPSSYTAARPAPLIIALHGLGGTEDSFFDAYAGKLPQLAEERGYILAAPLGYRVDGGYGWGIGAPPADPVLRRSRELSESDVMQVLAEARKHYRIDENRVYLMGHSMGAIGTWNLAAKYPNEWAAVGALSGRGAPSSVSAMRGIPQFVVHGDADPTVNVAGSRDMVAAMRALNVDVTYIEVPGGNHGAVVEPNLVGMLQFFDARRRDVHRKARLP